MIATVIYWLCIVTSLYADGGVFLCCSLQRKLQRIYASDLNNKNTTTQSLLCVSDPKAITDRFSLCVSRDPKRSRCASPGIGLEIATPSHDIPVRARARSQNNRPERCHGAFRASGLRHRRATRRFTRRSTDDFPKGAAAWRHGRRQRQVLL